MGSLNKKQRQLCKVEEMAATDAPGIEDEINNKLSEGWQFHSVAVRGNKVFLIFIR